MKIKMEDNEIKFLVSKKPKIIQKYHDNYINEWPCFIKSYNSLNLIFCIDCGKDFLIASGGCDHSGWPADLEFLETWKSQGIL